MFVHCCSEQPLAPQQLFLMSLICNVHPSSQFLDVMPSAPLQQQLLQPGGGLAPGQQQQLQRDAAATAAAAAGDEELLQVPVWLGAGPVGAGSEAPGEPCKAVHFMLQCGSCSLSLLWVTLASRSVHGQVQRGTALQTTA